jgi:hypothetical protein
LPGGAESPRSRSLLTRCRRRAGGPSVARRRLSGAMWMFWSSAPSDVLARGVATGLGSSDVANRRCRRPSAPAAASSEVRLHPLDAIDVDRLGGHRGEAGRRGLRGPRQRRRRPPTSRQLSEGRGPAGGRARGDSSGPAQGSGCQSGNSSARRLSVTLVTSLPSAAIV